MGGLVHIYTGNGKGKTTAALGLGLRACGRGFKVLMIQFLKGAETGEIKALDKLAPSFVLYRQKDVRGFFWNMNEEQKIELKESVRETWEYVIKAISSNEWDMLILDEIMGVISNNLISIGDVAQLIMKKPEKLEIILTGRNAPKELIELADYVSEIRAIKHPMEKGIKARKGIEY